MAPPKDPEKRKAWLEKIRKANFNKRGKKLSPEHIQKIREANRGKIRTEEHRKKYSKSKKGIPKSEEHKRKIKEFMSGPNNPNLGKPKSEETKRKISEAKKGITFTEKHKKKLSEWQLGKKLSENHKQNISKALVGKWCADQASGWKGGISFEPYCPKFNRAFKERVRAYFNFTCQECGTPENGVKHTPHHINYDKMVCCNTVKPLFILLCNPCNSKANFNREWWEEYFTNIVEQYFQGKCYFTPEEFKQFKGVT